VKLSALSLSVNSNEFALYIINENTVLRDFGENFSQLILEVKELITIYIGC
jgi:hypothetical protein